MPWTNPDYQWDMPDRDPEPVDPDSLWSYDDVTHTDEKPPGTRFEYDSENHAIIVRQGDLLRWAEFPDVGWRKLANNPPGTMLGDWLIWCQYDSELDLAVVVRAELLSHYQSRSQRHISDATEANLSADEQPARPTPHPGAHNA